MERLGKGWFSELSPNQDGQGEGVLGNNWAGQAFSLEVDRVLYHKKSQYQDVLVFQSKSYGKVLVLDGVIQCTERDEFSYHETMGHVALFAHRDPKNILIVGGGDGGVVREVIKHNAVQKVTLCEIDEDVITVSKEFLPSVSCSLSNEKVTVVVKDAIEFLNDQENVYDVIITDSSDPQGPAEGLFGLNFYKLLHKALKSDGILISQGECPWIDLELISIVLRNVKSMFPVVKYAISSVPTYTSGTMGYVVCGKDKDNDLTVPKTCREDINQMHLKFYTYALHQAIFVLPYFIHEEIKRVCSI